MSKALKKAGVIIGRFQPFHKGHKTLIDKAMKECEQVLVFIGSSNKLRDYRNPFSNEERKEFILRSYPKSTKLNIVFLHNKPSLSEWVGNVYGFINHTLGETNPADVKLYTSPKDEEFYGNTFLFEVEAISAAGLSGTSIRKDLYSDHPSCSKLMPLSTASMVSTITRTQHWERMKSEYISCAAGIARATIAHAFNNPIEPVVHAVVAHNEKILLVKRNSVRGYGQWALPGGFLEKGETTQAGALRELLEETGVDLGKLQCGQLAMALEENLDDLSVRTLGINFLFSVKPEEEIEVTIDPKEVLEYKWCPIGDITSEKELLFFNHNLVVQRLISIMSASRSPEGEQSNEPAT